MPDELTDLLKDTKTFEPDALKRKGAISNNYMGLPSNGDKVKIIVCANRGVAAVLQNYITARQNARESTRQKVEDAINESDYADVHHYSSHVVVTSPSVKPVVFEQKEDNETWLIVPAVLYRRYISNGKRK